MNAEDTAVAGTTGDLLEFQRKLQKCTSAREVLFVAVNETYALLRFDQAILWRPGVGGRSEVGAVSGLAELSPESPYSQWLVHAIDFLRVNKPATAVAVPYAELPASLVEDGREWVHEQLLHCGLVAPNGALLGGMLFHREEPFEEGDVAIAEWIGSAVGYALWAWRERSGGLSRTVRSRRIIYPLVAAAAIVATMMFVPVRLSAVAPAEITPEKPIPITSPTEGVVSRIVVQPNQVVKAGETLVELDDTSVRNRLAVAAKALDTARADYQRAANKSFTEEASKAELLVLDSRAREKAAEVAYLQELLQRLKITAPLGGVAIFNDAEEWRGRPVQPGERIMTIADPSLVAVTVFLPPEDAVELDEGAEVAVFLNVNPLDSLKAHIRQTSYEATPLPDNTLAYTIKAAIDREDAELPRIGQRGTAKVYGKTVSLGEYLLRKPILFLRRSLGF